MQGKPKCGVGDVRVLTEGPHSERRTGGAASRNGHSVSVPMEPTSAKTDTCKRNVLHGGILGGQRDNVVSSIGDRRGGEGTEFISERANGSQSQCGFVVSA